MADENKTANVSTMSITRALATVKSISAELETFFMLDAKRAADRTFIAITVGNTGKTFLAGLSKEQSLVRIQSDEDKLRSLHRRLFAIKAAINKSNAETYVTVQGKSMLVADAILLKTLLPFKQKMLDGYRMHYNSIQAILQREIDAFNKSVDAAVAAVVAPDTAPEARALIAENIRKTHQEMREPALLDPLDLYKKIKELEEEINFIKLELDYVLSESNTVTQITVEL